MHLLLYTLSRSLSHTFSLVYIVASLQPLFIPLGAFLSEWDGLSSTSEAPVVVLGATNRPMDLDKAFLRRMPVSIKLAPPDQQVIQCLVPLLIFDSRSY